MPKRREGMMRLRRDDLSCGAAPGPTVNYSSRQPIPTEVRRPAPPGPALAAAEPHAALHVSGLPGRI